MLGVGAQVQSEVDAAAMADESRTVLRYAA